MHVSYNEVYLLACRTLLPGNYLCGEIPEGIAPVIRTADAASIPDRLSIQQYNLGPCVEPPPLAMYPPTGQYPPPAPLPPPDALPEPAPAAPLSAPHSLPEPAALPTPGLPRALCPLFTPSVTPVPFPVSLHCFGPSCIICTLGMPTHTSTWSESDMALQLPYCRQPARPSP